MVRYLALLLMGLPTAAWTAYDCAIAGQWQVDLRPDPGAEPYFKAFEVTDCAKGHFSGRFYDTGFTGGRINTAWGATHFGFTTHDGRGVYFHSGILWEGTLYGRTMSEARDSLWVWTARREAEAAALPSGTDAASLLRALEGDWGGALGYRDYGNDKWVSIPLAVAWRAAGDGVTFVQQIRFTDPGREIHMTDVWTLDVDAAVVRSASIQDGRIDITEASLGGAPEVRGAEDWTLVLERKGTDNGRPAKIREVFNRRGPRLEKSTEVDFLDDEAVEWFTRNRIELVGVEPASR